VREGDRFILYTDGLVELGLDERTIAESNSTLITAAERLRYLPLKELPSAIVHELGADKPDDDVAVLVVEV